MHIQPQKKIFKEIHRAGQQKHIKLVSVQKVKYQQLLYWWSCYINGLKFLYHILKSRHITEMELETKSWRIQGEII
jgi:hypothetical protein